MAGLLADTHVLLWSMRDTQRLSPEIRRLLEEADTPPAFSVISIWEIAIKTNLGRPDFAINAEKMRDVLLGSGWHELEFSGAHALAAGGLPRIHGDPFDRALIGQAIVEEVELLTNDSRLRAYAAPIRLL